MALGSGDFQFCRQFAEGLSQVLKELPTPPLLVISSDLNHFGRDAENRRLDDIALQAMETLHPSKLYDTIMHQKITMCGMVPAVIVMKTLRLLGDLTTCQRMAYGKRRHNASRRICGSGFLVGSENPVTACSSLVTRNPFLFG